MYQIFHLEIVLKTNTSAAGVVLTCSYGSFQVKQLYLDFFRDGAGKKIELSLFLKAFTIGGAKDTRKSGVWDLQIQVFILFKLNHYISYIFV
jgi:hypothetical protein